MKFKRFLTEANKSDRLIHKIKDMKVRMFIDSYLKPKEKNWLDGNREIPAVVTTIDLNIKEKSVYLNRIDTKLTGKGYGKETLEFILKLTKGKGFKYIRAYTEFQAQDSQNMLSKLKFKAVDHGKGKYFERKI